MYFSVNVHSNSRGKNYMILALCHCWVEQCQTHGSHKNLLGLTRYRPASVYLYLYLYSWVDMYCIVGSEPRRESKQLSNFT